jgi:beta-glucosidase
MDFDELGEGFTWGVATAAYQIEGSPTADGKGLSIWDTFTHKRSRLGRGPIKDGSNGDIATDSYRRYREDIALTAAMGFDAYRFSLSWPRICPDGDGRINQAGLDHYRRMVDACLEAGIEPWVTLYHWDLPQALEDDGGWPNRETVFRFADYAGIVGAALGDRVTNWMVFNEALSFTLLGHMIGAHAPGRRGFHNFLPAAHHVNLATAMGARALRAAASDPVVGTTVYLSPPIGAGPGPLARQAERAADAVLNRLFLEPNLGLGYPWREAPVLRAIERHIVAEDERDLVIDLDFLGVQYYTRLRAQWLPIPGLWTYPRFGRDRSLELTSMGWEVRPEGLGMVLDKVHSYGRYDRIVVTEGGASFEDELAHGRVHDARRVSYYQSHLTEVAKARQRGIPVDGYFAWSLLDNFEWAEGYRPRFGLVFVDYPTQQRTIKDSGYWFARQLGGTATPTSRA